MNVRNEYLVCEYDYEEDGIGKSYREIFFTLFRFINLILLLVLSSVNYSIIFSFYFSCKNIYLKYKLILISTIN